MTRKQERQKLLYPFIGVPSIFFPVGRLKDGGTCEFATEKCLVECAVYKHLFSDEIIPYQTKEKVYRSFIMRDPLLVVHDIIDELREANSDVLCWFASGDCPSKNTKQVCQIARLLQLKGINQTMITRSSKLYKLLREKRFESDGHAIIGLALTIESLDSIDAKVGLFVMPDYEKGSIDFYIRKANDIPVKVSSFAAYSEMNVKKEKSPITNCKICFEERTGCFSEFKTDSGSMAE